MATISFPWLILLARFRDRPAVAQPPDYYMDFFTRNGAGGACDYWRAVSLNALDLTASRVFGWFVLDHDAAESDALVRQYGAGARSTLIQWAVDAAQRDGIAIAGHRQLLVVLNYGTDHGAAHNGILIIDQDDTLCEFGFICHEMGHGFGLPDSWSANPDKQYGDGWDLMSWQTTTHNFPIQYKDAKGMATVGLNARNLEALGAVPQGRLWQPAQPDFSAWLTLDPLNQPPMGNRGHLVAKVPPTAVRPLRANGSTYTVEFRAKAGWDQAIPQDVVIIHEVRNNGLSYLLPTVGGQFLAGSQFVTPSPEVYVQVLTIGGGPSRATVCIWDLPDGCLRRELNDPRVYKIENRAKRWITTPSALFALGHTWDDVRLVPTGALANIPSGPDIVQFIAVETLGNES